MYVWTRKEIAEAFDVSRATPHYWIHNYGPDSNHPFPEPVARLQVGDGGTTNWGMHQFVFDPGEVQQWFAGLADAKAERMSIAQRKGRTPARVDNLQIAVEAVAELRSAMAVLVATRSELVALQEEVGALASLQKNW